METVDAPTASMMHYSNSKATVFYYDLERITVQQKHWEKVN